MKKNNLVKKIASAAMATVMFTAVSAIASAANAAHDWNYIAAKNRMFAYCTVEGCEYNSQANSAELIITAENESFSGYKYSSAKVEASEWEEAGIEIPEIVYSGIENTRYAATTVAPASVGNYIASVTVDGQTASCKFEILKYAALNTPSGIVPVQATEENNGKLLGVDSTMEYRIAGGEWKEITSASVSNLASGEYEVRYCETDKYEPSEAVKVIIAGKAKAIETTLSIVEPIANSRYTDSEFELNCDFGSELPAGYSIVWTADSESVTLSPSNYGRSCYVTVENAGVKTVNITAKLVDGSGNVVKNTSGEEVQATNTITLTNGFFEVIVRIFKIFAMLNPTALFKMM